MHSIVTALLIHLWTSQTHFLCNSSKSAMCTLYMQVQQTTGAATNSHCNTTIHNRDYLLIHALEIFLFTYKNRHTSTNSDHHCINCHECSLSMPPLSVTGTNLHTCTHTHTQPCYSSMDFVWDNPGKPVPEETYTH